VGYFLISAAHKSSGKTTISIGLTAALRQRGLRVQTFKKGPDYIDPMWLAAASGRPCYNLDFHQMKQEEITSLFFSHLHAADIGLIEANKGLYDGLDLEGSNSNAALAILLGAPVVLVIDARGMTRGIAPLILGYQSFEPRINVAGVILNRLGGQRHEAKLRAVIEHYTQVPVLGAVPNTPEFEIHERHLGLVTLQEREHAQGLIDILGKRIADYVDLNGLESIAASPRLPGSIDMITGKAPSAALALHLTKKRRIGVMRDAAFNFYYADDIEYLDKHAEIIFIDALHDKRLPNIDGLIIGGGFPETQMRRLEANHDLRHAIKTAINDGDLPTYAECGGLMYLSQAIHWKNNSAEMVGIIRATTIMHDHPQGRGYVRLRPTPKLPWPTSGEDDIMGHEFHYSSLANLPENTTFAFAVTRGYGIDGKYDGIVHKNLLASYTHLRGYGVLPWPERFLRFVEWVSTQRSR